MVKVTAVSKSIGKNVKKFREKRGFTQEHLAFEARLNRAYIGYIERGERNPSTDTLVKIARALKVSPKELID
jgi:transcriptional regulator with XRE-family HTH domain